MKTDRHPGVPKQAGEVSVIRAYILDVNQQCFMAVLALLWLLFAE